MLSTSAPHFFCWLENPFSINMGLMTQQQYERSKMVIETATLLKEAKVRSERYGNEIAVIVSSPAGSVILNSVAEVSSFLAGVRFKHSAD